MNSKKHSFISIIPLWLQLQILMTLSTALLLGMILILDYRHSREYVMEQRISSSSRLLDIELQNMDQYIRDLASFCLQPLYDSEFNLAIKSKSPFTSSQQNYIKDQIRLNYHSRSDLNGYEIYFCHQDLAYGREKNSQHIMLLPSSSLLNEEGYIDCSQGKFYNSIQPASDSDSFFHYYQSIIRIQDSTPEAVVRLDVDASYARSLNQEHRNSEEFICIFNKYHSLLYSGDPALVSDSFLLDLPEDSQGNASFLTELGEKSYLAVLATSEKYELHMVSLLPMEVLNREIYSALQGNALMGILLWAVVSVLIFFILRIATRPLTRLSRQMQTVGNGIFSPLPEVSGSKEIADLSINFNDMVSHIDDLIRKNYLAEISEKTSRLTALEAQLNPHFLYNTLQAIGTEALLNDQPQINRMITSLASNLRYSIKEGDLVKLRSEITYVKNYVLLQEMRLEDRLNVTFDVEESLMELILPKISIQLLVENSIIHGMKPDSPSIDIRIQAILSDGLLNIIVADNGCGIPPEQLDRMEEEFRHFLEPGSAGKIGLANLYSRLHILYPDTGALMISSIPGEGTTITMQVPADPYQSKGGKTHVQSIDRG